MSEISSPAEWPSNSASTKPEAPFSCPHLFPVDASGMSLTLPDPFLTCPKGIFYNKAMTCLSLTPFSLTSQPSLISTVIFPDYTHFLPSSPSLTSARDREMGYQDDHRGVRSLSSSGLAVNSCLNFCPPFLRAIEMPTSHTHTHTSVLALCLPETIMILLSPILKLQPLYLSLILSPCLYSHYLGGFDFSGSTSRSFFPLFFPIPIPSSERQPFVTESKLVL